MPFYVYIIQSQKFKSFYKGFSENPLTRLQQHNKGEALYTSSKRPWILVYVEEFESKKLALIREKNLKKATTERIKALLNSKKTSFTASFNGCPVIPTVLWGRVRVPPNKNYKRKVIRFWITRSPLFKSCRKKIYLKPDRPRKRKNLELYSNK
ncbi:MAG: GIY-YIG nuclease family protein [Bacteroidetes bacterium]|nr:GIY-YIG nuclease family protein [Bacteroidota bacterium]